MKIGILGAGVAGLSAAYLLHKASVPCDVYEMDSVPGGLARSFEWHGFHCDLAPHRLFTTDKEVFRELSALVPLRELKRRSGIHIKGRWIQDPVNAVEMLLKFFPSRSFAMMRDYLFRKRYPEDSFQAMVLNQFGHTLNNMFFKPYSEKLFGIPASEISPVWGRKKIRVGGLKDLVARKTRLYFRRFHYPLNNGYGAIADALYRPIKDRVHLGHELVDFRRRPEGGYSCTFRHLRHTIHENYDFIISTLPLPFFARFLGLDLGFKFRSAKLAYLLVNQKRVSENHWFYFADADFIINRVAEFNNFAEQRLAKNKTVLCCEVTETQHFSVERVAKDLSRAGLVSPEDIVDAKTLNITHAYPIYDRSYEKETKRTETFFAGFQDIRLLGRQAGFVHKDLDEIYAEAKHITRDMLSNHLVT